MPGVTFTFVDADGPCEIGEMAPRGEMCPVSASPSTVFTGASTYTSVAPSFSMHAMETPPGSVVTSTRMDRIAALPRSS